jgi:formylglycine-generating enzyme required for sulfatase activity
MSNDAADDYIERLLESLALESGLVQRRDGGYSFTHYTLQEYLTARAYDRMGKEGVDKLIAQSCESRWRETILLAVGYWATDGEPDYALHLIRQLLDAKDDHALLLVAAALDDAVAEGVPELTPLRNETIQRLQAIAFSPDQCPDPKTRNEAAELLDRLDADTRPALDFTNEAYWAAPIAPGEFLLGDDTRGNDDNKPAMRYRILRPYALARFPVTNRQYYAFLADLERQKRSEEANKRCPRHWSGKRYRAGEGNHPVVRVTWYDMTAFAAWLDSYLKANQVIPNGDTIRLATEPEWERAAAYPVSFDGTGLSDDDLAAQKRVYPWGQAPAECTDTTLATIRASTQETGLGGTSVVGIFPHGKADCGAEELAGNVWEWCATPYVRYNAYPSAEKLPVDGEEEQGRNRPHVLRGGSWYLEQTFSFCVSRFAYRNDPINDYNGFRLARLFS